MDGQPPMTSKVFDYLPESKTYSLPDKYTAYLNRRSTAGKFAVFAQYILMMGTVEEAIDHATQEAEKKTIECRFYGKKM